MIHGRFQVSPGRSETKPWESGRLRFKPCKGVPSKIHGSPIQGLSERGCPPRAPRLAAVAARPLRPGLTCRRPFRPAFDSFPRPTPLWQIGRRANRNPRAVWPCGDKTRGCGGLKAAERRQTAARGESSNPGESRRQRRVLKGRQKIRHTLPLPPGMPKRTAESPVQGGFRWPGPLRCSGSSRPGGRSPCRWPACAHKPRLSPRTGIPAFSGPC